MASLLSSSLSTFHTWIPYFYRDSDGTPVVPWGTLTIEETKAPDGYKIEDSTVSVNGQVLSNRIYFTRVSDKVGEQPSESL